jgi:hypothetical protein
MAENKKSFILYCDLIHTVKKLPDDKAGILFKHLLSYVNDENPTTDDLLVEVAFEPIKRQLKRDLEKFEEVKIKRSEAGKLGGRPKNQTKAKKANALFEKQTKAKKADTDNDNVNDNVINKKDSDFDLAFKDFEKMRKLIKKPLTDRARNMILTKLDKLATDKPTQIKILENSIVNNWQDIYPLKENNKVDAEGKDYIIVKTGGIDYN